MRSLLRPLHGLSLLVFNYWVCTCSGQHGRALLVVDMQGCFLPGGALPTQPSAGTLALVRTINTLRTAGCFDVVVFTQDWHPPNHVSFAAVHGRRPLDSVDLHYTSSGQLCSKPGTLQPGCMQQQHIACNCSSSTAELGAGAVGHATHHHHQQQEPPIHKVQQVLWPPHCLQLSSEARLHPGLINEPHDIILRKGWQPHLDAYSAFQDNGRVKSTGLAELLKQQGIRSVVVAGVALEYCVLYSAMDAAREGFETIVVLDATAPVDAAGAEEAVQQLRQANVSVVQRVWDVVPARGGQGATY